ncbi:MAG: PAS domain-containing protein [Coleofasciculaceae cyanobacterium]
MAKKINILIIDNCLEDRETYRRYLSKDTNNDWTIFEEEFGEKGLEQCHQLRPELILLDFLLLDLDGLEFLQELRKFDKFANLPVIMLTGEGDEEVATQAFKYGVQDYLIKGKLTQENLCLTVNRVIQQSQLQTLLLKSKERQTLIATTALRINQSLNLENILNTTVTGVRQLLNSDRVLVYKFKPDMSGEVVAESVAPGWLASLGSHITDTCFQQGAGSEYRQGRKKAIADIYQAGLSDCHIKLLEQFQVKANLVVPILLATSAPSATQLWGLLIAHQCDSMRQWEAEELQLLDELAVQIGTAIEKAQLYSQLQAELRERKQAEAALRRSEQLYRTIACNFPASAVLLFDADLRYLVVEGKGLAESGLTEKIMRGKTIWEVFPRETCAVIEPQYRAALNGISTVQEIDYAEHTYYVCTVPIKDEAEKVFAGLVVTQDISDRKRSELALQESHHLLQTIIDTSPDVIGVKDLQGNYQLINSSGAKLLNKPVEEIIGQTITNLFPEEEVTEIIEQERQIIASGKDQTFEYCFLSNGKQQIYLTTKTVYRNPQGEVIGLVDYGKDITKLKQVQESLSQANEQLEQRVQTRTEELVKSNAKLLRTNAELENFAYIAAHDLREPLRRIKCYTEWLVDSYSQKLDAKADCYINYIADGALRLQAQITDLLLYSKLLREEICLKPTALDEVLQESLSNLSLEIEKNHALIKAESLPIVQANFSQMVQLFTQLLDNTLKFRSEVNPNIEIKVQQQGEQWVIAVSDNGIGIKTRYTQKIFEIFQRLHGWGKYPGTGIGLAICKKIVERNGGQIWVKSQPGVGTTVYFSMMKTEN